MSDEVLPPVFNGAAVVLMNDDPLWIAMRVSPGLLAGVSFRHLDPPNQSWVPFLERVLDRSNSLLERVAMPIAALHGDSIGWIIQCHSAVSTNQPVFLQVCQGVDDTHLRPVTRVARYDVELTANQARLITDAIQIQ